MQQLGPYMGLGVVLAASVVGGTVGGHYLDRWLGTSPWLTLAGVLLGISGGMTSVLRTLLSKEAKR